MKSLRRKRTDPYFTKEGPNGAGRGMNPYFHGRGIFRYDPKNHGQTKPGGGADFTVGARYAAGSMLGEATIGRFGGLAVFNRALTEAEMKALHDSAKVEALKLGAERLPCVAQGALGFAGPGQGTRFPPKKRLQRTVATACL